MRLWHQDLIHYLDNRRLLSQHRECCALRGQNWNRKHSTVDYVFKHSYALLYHYHMIVMLEMKSRGYSITYDWFVNNYHGKVLGYSIPDDKKFYSDLMSELKTHSNQKWNFDFIDNTNCLFLNELNPKIAYIEHNDQYLKECIDNLKNKNAQLVNGKSLAQFELTLGIKGL